jgi:hypothetical protein
MSKVPAISSVFKKLQHIREVRLQSESIPGRTVRHSRRLTSNANQPSLRPNSAVATKPAGPTGYGFYRQIVDLGHRCDVVAPSLIPKRAGEPVKTNRRDAVSLARLLRAGELKGIWVTDAVHEALRVVRHRTSRGWRFSFFAVNSAPCAIYNVTTTGEAPHELVSSYGPGRS